MDSVPPFPARGFIIPPLPTVSAVIALHNRADAVERAIRSVQNQTFTDWELIVVDDGSTDNSAAIIESMREPRLTLIRQQNKGFVEARNTGLRAAKSEILGFLDDDDEWLPLHLELGVRFLQAHPEAMFVGTELREDFGQGRHLIHFRAETGVRYPYMASMIQSKSFDLPAGETDDYRRIYESKVPVGAWGTPILERAGIREPVYHYSGNLFPHLRWGYLMAVNSLLVRQKGLAEVGFQNTAYNYAADYHLIGELSRRYPAHFISVPTYIKHELNKDGKVLASSHLVTGTSALTCAEDTTRAFEDLFWKADPNNPELRALRADKRFAVALIAIQVGERNAALDGLRDAREGRHVYWKAMGLEGFIRMLPWSLVRKVFSAVKKFYFACLELQNEELSLGSFCRKALSKLLP